MPQMMPLNWVSLYSLFSILLILLIIVNYFMFMYKPKILKLSKQKFLINWKW